MAEAPQLPVFSFNGTTHEAIMEPASLMDNDRKQEEETYELHRLSASPSSDDIGIRPRIRYGKEELLNLRFVASREEQPQRWNEIMAVLGPVGCELCAMEKSGQTNTDSKSQRRRKKKQCMKKMEIIREEQNDKKQEEENYDPYHLSAFPSSDGNVRRPRRKYGKKELLNLRCIMGEEEHAARCDGIMAALESAGCDLCTMEKIGQMNADSRRQRACKKIDQVNKTEAISSGMSSL